MKNTTSTTPARKTAAKKSTTAAKPQPKPEPAKPAKLTSEQKRRVAWVLLAQAAIIADTWDDYKSDYECDDVPAELLPAMFSQWLQYLPHDAWPTSFPEPTSKYVRGDV